MCFYPWPQTADSPFGQNLFAKQGFADRSFVFYYFLYLGSKDWITFREKEIFGQIFIRSDFGGLIIL